MSQGRYSWPVPVPDAAVRWVSGVLDGMDAPYHVLDPVSGAGTVLYGCGLRGWRCTGLEGDPLMRWISTARSRRFRPDAAEFAGYAWERVADDVFWEARGYALPEVEGSFDLPPEATSFLCRTRWQIDRETDEGINDLLRLALCRMLPEARAAEEFDDSVGMGMFASALAEIGASLEPNPERGQAVHLADGRRIPPMLRDSYDAVVSVLPPIGLPDDAELRRTMCRWIGFTDLENRDSMCIGHPLGHPPDGGSGSGPDPELAEALGDLSADPRIVRWFEGVCALAASVSGVLSPSGEAHLLVPDERIGGAVVRKAEILAHLIESSGLACEAEGSGETACVAVSHRMG